MLDHGARRRVLWAQTEGLGEERARLVELCQDLQLKQALVRAHAASCRPLTVRSRA